MRRRLLTQPRCRSAVGLGYGGDGALGLGNTNNQWLPVEVIAPAGQRWVDIDANSLGRHVVAITAPIPEPRGLAAVAVSGLALLVRRQRALRQ